MKKYLKIGVIALLSIITVCVAIACALLYVVFTPARLTPIANGALGRYLAKADASVEQAELTYFSTFPFFSVKLKNVLILSKGNQPDTLAYIPLGSARLNLSELLNRNVIIDELELNCALSRVAIDSAWRLNWDVFPTSAEAKKEKTTTPLDSLLKMADIKKIRIKTGKFTYENAVSKQSATAENAEIQLKGSLAQHNLTADLNINLKNANYRDSAISAELSGLKLNAEANISNILPAPSDSQPRKIDARKIRVSFGKATYKNVVSKQEGVLENAEITLNGSFAPPRLSSDLALKLQSASYQDTLIKAGASNLQLNLNAEAKLSDIPSAPFDSLFDSANVKKIYVNAGKIRYENAASKQTGAAENAEINLEGSFAQRHLLAKTDISLQNAGYRDSLVKTDMSILKLKLNGGIQDSNAQLEGAVHLGKLGFNYGNENFLDNAELRLSIDNTTYNAATRGIGFKEIVLGLNGITLRLGGGALIQPSGFKPDVRFALEEAQLKSLYGMIPSKYVSGIDTSLKIYSGSIACSGKVQGAHSKKSKLQLQAALGVKKLKCKFQEFNIDSIDAAADCKIPLNDLSAAAFSLKKFNYWGDLGDASIQGNLDGLGANPFIAAQVAANLNLRDLRHIMKDNKEFTTEGKVNLDLKGSFKLRDLLEFKPENLNINGAANIDTVVISNPRDSLSVFIDFARLRFGAQVDDTTLSTGKALLKGSVRLDSLDLNYKNMYVAKAGRLSAGYKCEDENIANVNTQSARFSVRGLNLQMPQKKTRFRTARTSTRAVIKANPDKPASPLLTLTVSSDTLAYRDRAARTGIRLGSADLSLNVMPIVPRVRSAQTTGGERGATARRDSTRVRRPPELKEMSSSDLIKLLVSIVSDKDTAADLSQNFLRMFNYDGNLQFSDSRLRAPALSLPLQITSTTVSIANSRELSLKNAQISMGNSDLLVTGVLENFRRALLGRGILRANAQVKSKKIDLNELMLAMAKKDAETAAPAEDSDKDFFDVKLDTAARVSKVFVIPENLDLSLQVDIDTLMMGRSELNRLHGALDIKQQYLHLNNFNLFNKAGQIDLKLLYRAQTPKEANLWATLNLDRAAIRDLIDIYPEIDSLLPMTKSLEGLIDCNVQITTKLDSAMSILLPHTVADFSAKGKNLVLLDGETFSKIAKTLMFKNKSRNMMDSISINLVVKDNAVEIFPMVIAIDRYKFAVGGVQNLDMSFNYHVTVLESPLSFKLGVDISGGANKFNYKIARPKYKNVEKPVISKEFADRTVSVRSEIKRLIDYEFEHITESLRREEDN
ncbi:MAG: hypothetical protein LBB74_08995 [Chitinispirillales bacterium]|nr:hypothetical protein [Chitinispirillales bacterium]